MSSIELYKRIMRYIESYKYYIGLYIMFTMFAITSIIQSVAIKYLIDAAEKKDLQKLVFTSGGLIITIVILIVLIPFFRFMYNGNAVVGKGIMKKDAFRRIVLLPVTYFENTHSGIIMTNITSDIEIAADLITWRFPLAMSPFLYAFFAILPMLLLNWKISLILILLNVLLSGINLLFSKPIKSSSEKIQESLDMFHEKLFNMLAGFSVMKLFHIEDIIAGYYTEACNRYAKYSLERVRLSACVDSLNEFIGRASSLGMIMAGVWLVDSNVASIGTILTLITLQNDVNGSFLQAGRNIPQLQQSFVSGKRVFETMDIEPEPESYPTDYQVISGAALSMKTVSFSYDNETSTITDITLTVKHGQKVALVGPSGSGKSTILKLFLGFYPPTHGNIIVNEKSLGQYTLSQVRNMISYVPQDAYLFYGTIEENIRYGNVNATDEEVTEAAKAAYIHDFIMEQSKGYQTIIGENGITLSGGQKQRVAIARAFLKNSPILLLDEATASLDAESEKYVYEAMDALMKNRTILLIAHRLSTVENADIVYVIDEGKVVEQGNHSELLAHGVLYRDLYYRQYTS